LSDALVTGALEQRFDAVEWIVYAAAEGAFGRLGPFVKH
jgi:hypothetical protein